MPSPDKINKSTQEIENLSFDDVFNIEQCEPLTLNPISGNLERITAIQGNASITISNTDSAVVSTKTITKTINGVNYTKTLSYNAAGDLLSISAWS